MSNSLHPAVPTAADEPTMSPIRTFRALTLASITGLALASTGCMSLVGADQATVTITNAVQPVTAGPGCAVNADPIANGVLDLALNTGYLAALNVRTNLPSTINTQQLAQQGGSYPNYGNGDANIVSFQRSYVYTRDGEVGDLPFNILQPTANVNNGAIAGLPSETTPRITSTTGIVFNEQQNLVHALDAELAALASEREKLQPLEVHLQAAAGRTAHARAHLAKAKERRAATRRWCSSPPLPRRRRPCSTPAPSAPRSTRTPAAS